MKTKLNNWQGMRSIRAVPIADLIILVVSLALAIILRLSLIDFKSIDFIGYFRPWFNELKLHGFHAFKNNFFDYYPPYLYLVYFLIRLFPDAPAIVITKIPSMTADFVCAFLTYQISRLKLHDSQGPIFAGLVVLFAPTVVINSAMWGQTDALFSAALLCGLLLLLVDRIWLGLIAFGIAFSFKAQSIFLTPLLLALCLRRQIPWKSLLMIPLVMAIALIPTWMAGRPLPDLLQIYPAQAGEFEQLTLNAPSLYALIPDNPQTFQVFFPLGIVFTGILCLLFVLLVLKSRANMSTPILVELMLLSFMFIPFFLPKMHERYFYPADVISIIYAVYFPGYFFVPIFMGAISFFAYLPFLFGEELVPMPFLAIVLFLLILFITIRSLKDLSLFKTSKTEDAP